MSTTEDDDATLPLLSGAARSALLLADRYEVGPLLGRGGSGQVHRARDRLSGRDVAIKFVPIRHPEEATRLRQERAALRWLRLPGVVALLDDGEADGTSFLVMELLDGGWFSDLRAGGWSAWEDAARSLLETLAAIHHAGVVHRDLKPTNVLLDGDRRPRIADFGIAIGRPVSGERHGPAAGTPRYLAPEVLAGGAATIRADLYAVGVMFHEMLSGRAWDGDVHPMAAPDPVAEVVRDLLAPDPDARPADAGTAIGRLWPGPSGPTLPDLHGISRRRLPRVFGPPRRTFQHLEADAAERLWTLGAGDPDRMAAVLAGWVRWGLVRAEGGTLSIADAVWRRAEPMGRPEGPPAQWAARATALAVRAVDRGHPNRALEALDRTASLLPDTPRSVVRRWLVVYADAALWSNQIGRLDLALYQVDRAEVLGVEADDLRAVVRGARAVLGGERSRGVDCLAALPAMADDRLEIWRVGTQIYALSHEPVEVYSAAVEALEPWSNASAERRASFLTWRGQSAYRRGDYRAAVEAHRGSAELRPRNPNGRAGSWMHAASAALEVPDLALAEQLGRAARRLAARSRNPVVEAHAAYMVRAARFRANPWIRPDPSWTEAAVAVSPMVEGLFALLDGAVALRTGDPRGMEWAERARSAFLRVSNGRAAAVAGALAVALGAADDVEPLLEGVAGHPTPIAIQIVALVALGRPERREELARIANVLARAASPAASNHRREVLSIAEALAVVAAGSPHALHQVGQTHSGATIASSPSCH